MAKITHVCIKPDCTNTYQDEEVDAYYCDSCRAANKILAAKIDAKIKANPRKEVKKDSEIERWKKEGGFMPILR